VRSLQSVSDFVKAITVPDRDGPGVEAGRRGFGGAGGAGSSPRVLRGGV